MPFKSLKKSQSLCLNRFWTFKQRRFHCHFWNVTEDEWTKLSYLTNSPVKKNRQYFWKVLDLWRHNCFTCLPLGCCTAFCSSCFSKADWLKHLVLFWMGKFIIWQHEWHPFTAHRWYTEKRKSRVLGEKNCQCKTHIPFISIPSWRPSLKLNVSKKYIFSYKWFQIN